MPPGVRIGVKSVAWAAAELESVVRARVAGVDADGVRGLVAALVASRSPDRSDDDVRRIAAEFFASRAAVTKPTMRRASRAPASVVAEG